MIDDDWHAPILVVLGLLLLWNLFAAWLSIRPSTGAVPTALQVRAGHLRIFFSAFAYSLISLGLGIGRARRGGSIAPYGMVAVGAMLVAVLVLLATYGVRSIG
ncbi:MAG: hypothetical protein OEM97_03750 [Acidimicrobiia bacterium]|nr:hypothetical protein [Acidimicrobiia bacterium]